MEYYPGHPIYPLKKTVIDINFEVLQPLGVMNDIFIIGKGQSASGNYDPLCDISRTMDDLKLMYEINKKLSDSYVFPTWHDNVIYKKIRDKHKCEDLPGLPADLGGQLTLIHTGA